jgi:hypothetical protein
MLAPLSVTIDTTSLSSPLAISVEKAEAAPPLILGGLVLGSVAAWYGGGSWIKSGIETVVAYAGAALITLAATFLALAGVLFDYTIWAFAANFTGTLEFWGVIDAIRRVWVVFRDLSQIVLIGFFIFIAINIILNNHEYSIKQHAVRAILVALFMNFSLFFSMAVIDVSNFVAYQFYRGIAGVGGSAITDATGVTSGQANISQRISTAFGITELNDWSKLVDKLKSERPGSPGLLLVTSIGIAIIFLISAFVFFYCSWLLTVRAVMLMLVMVTSSLATAALIIPSFSKYFNEWRTSLLANAFFAPLLLLMLWTVIQIMDAIAKSPAPGLRVEGIFDPTITNAGGALGRYAVMVTLFVVAVKVADMLAKKGNQLFGLNVGGTGGGAAFGGMLAAAPLSFSQSRSRARAAERLKAQRDEVESKLGTEKDAKKRQGLIDQREKIQKRIESGGGAFSAKIDKILGSMQKLATGKESKSTAIKDIIKKKDDKEKAEAKKIVEATQPHVDADKAYDQHIGQQQKIAEKGPPPSEEDTKTLKVQLGAVEATRKELAEKAAAQPEPKTDVEKQEQAKNVKAIQEHDEQIKQLRSQINKQAEEREAYQTAQNDLAQFAAPDEKTRVDARNRFIERQMQAANNPASSAATQQKARLEQTIRSTLGVENKRVLDMATTELLKDKATKEREKLFGLLEKAGEKAEAPKAEAPKGPAPAAAKADDHATPH